MKTTNWQVIHDVNRIILIAIRKIDKANNKRNLLL